MAKSSNQPKPISVEGNHFKFSETTPSRSEVTSRKTPEAVEPKSSGVSLIVGVDPKPKGASVTVQKEDIFHIGSSKANAPEPIQDDNNVFSPSQVTMFMRCQLQYFFRYMCGIKRRPNGNMARGSAIHKSFEKSYHEKFVAGELLPPDDMTDIFIDDFRRRISGEHEEDRQCQLEPGEDQNLMETQAIRSIKLYRQEIMPELNPGSLNDEHGNTYSGIELGIEKLPMPFIVPDLKMTGYIDLLTDTPIIVDVKNSGREPNKSPLMVRDKLVQLVIYDMMMQTAFGIDVEGLRLDYNVLLKTKSKLAHAPNADGSPFKPPHSFFKQVVAIIRNMRATIQAGTFTPNYSPMICSWCGYQAECDKWTGYHG